ncbi:hypothetical protein GF378_00845 [Candidatus Pacearchaeota archaeon]|nr:hypothetical protein [Candidatus Pacearchaeota archaeon]
MPDKIKERGIKGAIIFDASTLISLSMNGLLEVLIDLKKQFKGKFLITRLVKEEVIDRPIKTKRFGLEALRVKKLLDNKVLEMPSSLGIKSQDVEEKTQKIIDIANSMFVGKGKNIELIHNGEASCLALSRLLLDKKIPHVIAIDERTTRMLGEKPENLKKLLSRKMNTKIKLKQKDFKYFRGFKFIRSSELMYVAWKKGLIDLKDGGSVLDALLFAVKFKGCSISNDEIEKIKKIK